MGNPVDLSNSIAKAKRGDTEAFGVIYETLLDAIYRFVYFRVGDKPTAEDITETIFVSAYEHIHGYQERGLPFQAWMYRIARNKITDHYRKHKPHTPLDVAIDVPDSSTSPEQAAEDALTSDQVKRAIARLPETYQEIIILKYIEEKTNEEISVLLDKPIAHVRVLQSRALKKLREAL